MFLATYARRSGLWPWVPLGLAAVYAVSLFSNFHSVVQSIYLHSDEASALSLGQLYADAPHGAQTVLGRFPWYTTLWFESLTRGLPAHRQLWELAPWVVSLLGVGLVAWSTARAAGRWAGAMVAVVLACASPALLQWQFSWSVHAWTPVHVCVLGAFLVRLAARGGMAAGRRSTHWLACGTIAAITAAGLASDSLLGPAGVVPFLVAGVAMVWLLDTPAGQRVAVSATVVAVLSAIGAAIISHAMTAARVVAQPSYKVNFSQYDELAGNVGRLGHALLHLFNGDFVDREITSRSVLALACAVVVGVAVVAGVRVARGWLTGPRYAVGAAPVRTAHPARAAHLAFWIVSAAVLSTTLVLAALLTNADSSKYTVAVAYAIPAVVVAASAGRRWPQALTVAGVCVVVAGSIAGLWGHDIRATARFGLAAASGPLLRTAQAEHLRYGYARYADAAILTWQMKLGAEVYPVQTCRKGRQLCPWPFHRISSWYSPRPRTRTFLVTDVLSRRAISSLGKPAQVFRAARLTVYVYQYDIASRLMRCDLPGSRLCPK
ncbi:MAG: hypothetical protein QOK25_1855 [Thermoleophilaceae bacterium]|nr:hypothetical protein [Thermoleophilaceae bacterium]